MSRKKLIITLPLDLILDARISSNAKIVYAVLQSLMKGKPRLGQIASVRATHRDLMEKSRLSLHTITKALNSLIEAGWISRVLYPGSANEYRFTTTA